MTLSPALFTDRARTLLIRADHLARSFDHRVSGPSHVLLALLSYFREGRAVDMVRILKLDDRRPYLLNILGQDLRRSSQGIVSGSPTPAISTTEVLEKTVSLSRDLGHRFYGTGQIFLAFCQMALVGEARGQPFQLIREMSRHLPFGYVQARDALIQSMMPPPS